LMLIRDSLEMSAAFRASGFQLPATLQFSLIVVGIKSFFFKIWPQQLHRFNSRRASMVLRILLASRFYVMAGLHLSLMLVPERSLGRASPGAPRRISRAFGV